MSETSPEVIVDDELPREDMGEDTDYTTIGPEAFTNGNVIGYKGENYYRACNFPVTQNADGSGSFCVKRTDHPGFIHEDYEGRVARDEAGPPPSALVQHARRELEILGEDPDVIEKYIPVFEAFEAMGHSGASSQIAIPIIAMLLQHKNLKPLTNHPDEWMHHPADGPGGKDLWQNVRNGEAFSLDFGKTYQLLSETGKGKKKLHYSTAAEEVYPQVEEPATVKD